MKSPSVTAVMGSRSVWFFSENRSTDVTTSLKTAGSYPFITQVTVSCFIILLLPAQGGVLVLARNAVPVLENI